MDPVFVFVVFGLGGLVLLSWFRGKQKDRGRKKQDSNPPVIVKYGASEKVTAGQPWRVFVAARDPDGDMAQIRFEIKQPGKGLYRAHWKKLDRDLAGGFSGYFYLNTPKISPDSGLALLFITLELRCKIYDRADRASEEIRLPFQIVADRIEQPVPADFHEYDARSLGAIMIQLRSS
jgi:hypothetical protein